jgi:hypothetical protein
VIQGLFISGDISHSSTTLGSVGAYYHQTKDIAVALAIMFEVAFPELYLEYQEAFEAGIWFQDDPGPFLGRAVIYKLQSKLHKDRNDVGPSASFPVGCFEGGEMLFPQLRSKLRSVSYSIIHLLKLMDGPQGMNLVQSVCSTLAFYTTKLPNSSLRLRLQSRNVEESHLEG